MVKTCPCVSSQQKLNYGTFFWLKKKREKKIGMKWFRVLDILWFRSCHSVVSFQLLTYSHPPAPLPKSGKKAMCISNPPKTTPVVCLFLREKKKREKIMYWPCVFFLFSSFSFPYTSFTYLFLGSGKRGEMWSWQFRHFCAPHPSWFDNYYYYKIFINIYRNLVYKKTEKVWKKIERRWCHQIDVFANFCHQLCRT